MYHRLMFVSYALDTDSSRKLREEFAKTCFETLLQFSYINRSKADDSCITKLAVISLLQRCQDVVRKYAEDEKLSGKCPLPRYDVINKHIYLTCAPNPQKIIQ